MVDILLWFFILHLDDRKFLVWKESDPSSLSFSLHILWPNLSEIFISKQTFNKVFFAINLILYLYCISYKAFGGELLNDIFLLYITIAWQGGGNMCDVIMDDPYLLLMKLRCIVETPSLLSANDSLWLGLTSLTSFLPHSRSNERKKQCDG